MALARILYGLAAGTALILAPNAEAQEWLDFDVTEANLGEISDTSGVQTVEFKFRNCSGRKVEIKTAVSCKCLRVSVDKPVYKAGEAGKATLIFNPYRMSGQVDVMAIVTASDIGKVPMSTPVNLRLRANVKISDEWDYLPVRIGDLGLKRDVAEIPRGEKVTRILCANTGEKPLEPKIELLPEGVEAYFEPSVIEGGREADMVVKCSGSRRDFGLLVKAGTGAALIYVNFKK